LRYSYWLKAKLSNKILSHYRTCCASINHCKHRDRSWNILITPPQNFFNY